MASERETITFAEWLKVKDKILRGISGKKASSFTHSRNFYSEILKVEPCEEIEREKRDYGLAPPSDLTLLSSDSPAIRFTKKELWKCFLGSQCSNRQQKREKSDLPPILVRLKRENLWSAVQKAGFTEHKAGKQFLCLCHLRHAPDARDSRRILNHWLVKKRLPDKVFFVPGSKTETPQGREGNEAADKRQSDHKTISYRNFCLWQYLTGVRTEETLKTDLGAVSKFPWTK